MAIAPTGNIFKCLEFDGETSKSYGVYITGEAVYNAPERDVETVSIPGRNGAFALDNGRFENIEVRYPAGIFANNEMDFAEAISDFRNFLCSKKGYCRLTDDYNPDEFRMAIYKSGLEVTPAMLRGGEFEIVFDCKPQRYLMSGEADLAVSDGDTIFNPTLFEAKPLLAIEGTGIFSVNDYDIEIVDEQMGKIELQHSWLGDEVAENALISFYDKIAMPPVANAGDDITANMTAIVRLQSTNTEWIKKFGAPSNIYVTDGNGNTVSGANATVASLNNKTLECRLTMPITYTFIGATQSQEYTLHFTISPTDGADVAAYGTFECDMDVKFWQTATIADYPLTFIADINAITSDDGVIPAQVLDDYTISRINLMVKDVYVDSTMDVCGSPTYIDCELGEAYKIVNDEMVSLNRFIALGANLPVLNPGTNTFAAENTITSMSVTPRWWKI